MTTFPRVSSLIGWLLPVVMGLFLIVDPLLLSPVHYGFLGAIAGSVMLIISMWKRIYLFQYPVLLLMLGTVVVSASAASFSWNPLEYSLVAGTAVMLVAVVSTLPPDLLRKALKGGLFIFLAVILIPIAIQYIRQLSEFGVYGYYSVPSGMLLNPNVLGRLLGLSTCFYLATRRDGGVTRTTDLVILLLSAGVVWTGSRGAMLGLFVAGLVYLGRRWELSGIWWLLVGGLVLGFVVILVGRYEHVTNMQRIKLARESLWMVLKQPFSGVGPWNFGLEYPAFSLDGQWQRHPHSLPLWILTSFGLLGVVTTGYLIKELWTYRSDGRFIPLMVFFLVHEAVDTMLWIPGMVFITVLLLIPMFRSDRRQPILPNNGAGATVAINMERVLLVTFVGLSLFTVWTGYHFKAGVGYARGGHWEKAKSSWQSVPQSFGLAHRALVAYKQGRNRRARAWLRRAESRNPLDPYYPYVLSTVFNRAGARRRYESRDPHDTLSFNNPPEDWGRDNYPPGFRIVGESRLKPGKIIRHPRRAGWYLPLVDRAIRRSRCDQALRRISVLLDYPEVTRFGRIQLESRRLSCYRIMGQSKQVEAQHRRLTQLRSNEPALRATYHQFFYRRMGYDHVFFK